MVTNFGIMGGAGESYVLFLREWRNWYDILLPEVSYNHLSIILVTFAIIDAEHLTHAE